MFIAVTNNDELNLLACLTAFTLGAKNRVARVRSNDFFAKHSVLSTEDMGVDLLINPEEVAAEEILNHIQRPFATEVMTFAKGQVEMFGLRIGRQSPLVNRSLREIGAAFNTDFRCVVIIRAGNTLIPTGKESIFLDDHVFIIVAKKNIPKLVEELELPQGRFNSVFIAGGSKLGQSIATKLEHQQYQVKLVEANKKKSYKLSEKLEKTLVLHGSTLDMDLLKNENLSEIDVFVATTNDEETNILSCVIAKNLGVKKTMTNTLNVDYLNFISGLNIDVIISQKLVTVSQILKYIRGTKIVSATAIAQDNAEVLEFKVSENARITQGQLKELNFPSGGILGIISRGKEVIIPTGQTRVIPRDKVFVFALPRAVSKVEKLF